MTRKMTSTITSTVTSTATPKTVAQRLTPLDLLRVRMADDPQLSPDGTQVAWVQSWLDADANGYRSELWITEVAGGDSRRATVGAGQDTYPRWSPDGRSIAYLSTLPPGASTAGAPQLCLLDVATGEGRVLTALPRGAADPTWSPDGTQLVATTLLEPDKGLTPAVAAPEDDDLYHKFNRDVLVAKRRKWKLDGAGYLGDLRTTLIRVRSLTAAMPVVDLIAQGDFDLYGPAWSPDGARLAAVGNLDADADAVRRQSLYLLDMTGPLPVTPRQLFGLEDIRQHQIAWSPNGAQIALAGHNNPRIGHYGNQQLWVVDVATGAGNCITRPADDYTLGHAAYTDVGRYAGDEGVRWSPDGRQILALISQGGVVHVHRIDVATGATVPVTTGEQTVAAFTLDAAGQRLVALVREPLNPGDIFLYSLTAEPTGHAPTAGAQLTDVNGDWLRDFVLSTPQKFQFDADGRTIDAWLLPPAGSDINGDQRYSAILYTGGGPAGMRAANFLFEYQMLAAAGYAVIFCNARGCQGYGEDFCTAILGAWGGHDYADNLRCVEEACARFPLLDPDRVGIAGGSYGGYLVNWALGHTDRFRAAVSDRSVFNRHSSFGTSDIGHLREFEFGDGPPWEVTPRYLAQSPLTYIGGATTPTLVIHSAQDLRCAVEQGEQLYLALKRLNVATELIRFPNESHGLSRGGQPWHRIFRLQAYLTWFDKWL